MRGPALITVHDDETAVIGVSTNKTTTRRDDVGRPRPSSCSSRAGAACASMAGGRVRPLCAGTECSVTCLSRNLPGRTIVLFPVSAAQRCFAASGMRCSPRPTGI